MPAYAYGPGLLSISHGRRSSCDTDRIVECAAIYARTAATLLERPAAAQPVSTAGRSGATTPGLRARSDDDAAGPNSRHGPAADGEEPRANHGAAVHDRCILRGVRALQRRPVADGRPAVAGGRGSLGGHPAGAGAEIDAAAASVLAALWLWGGAVYHAAYFTRINPAAWALPRCSSSRRVSSRWYGVARRVLRIFVAQRRCLEPWASPSPSTRWCIRAEPLAGHTYPAMRTFGRRRRQVARRRYNVVRKRRSSAFCPSPRRS